MEGISKSSKREPRAETVGGRGLGASKEERAGSSNQVEETFKREQRTGTSRPVGGTVVPSG